METVVGVFAHVDAGKTTLSEQLLYRGGTLRRAGRVDSGDTCLDHDVIERSRGITVFADEAAFTACGLPFRLIDTPGHADFSGEMERSIWAVDCAVLVVSCVEGVQAHTETVWRLLRQNDVPVVFFLNKADLPTADAAGTLAAVRARLGADVLACGPDFCAADIGEALAEELAARDETLMEDYLVRGYDAQAARERGAALVRAGLVCPAVVGAALNGTGVDTLLNVLAAFCAAPQEEAGDALFRARVYKVRHEKNGGRIVFLKVLAGRLRPKENVACPEKGGTAYYKVNGLRAYSGGKSAPLAEAGPGTLCAAAGLGRVMPGDVVGADARPGMPPALRPLLSAQVLAGPELPPRRLLELLREVEDEEPLLGVEFSEELQRVNVQVMGEVQLEVLQAVLRERYGAEVSFGPCGVLYRETIANAVVGCGHFEPLRHYAEVHLRLSPGAPGSGITFDSECHTDVLAQNWQNLIRTHVLEKSHRGVLTGAPLTDVRVTLLAGRAHLKHTEGGDFRQAVYRAVRQGLMQAESVLLEPWYRFRLEVPAQQVGRAMTDLQQMGGKVDPPETVGEETALTGTAPVAGLRDYAREVAVYTRGQGRLSCVPAGYFPCTEAEAVIEAMGYDPERDVENTADSVFCSHGAGVVIPWREVAQHAQVDSGWRPQGTEPEPKEAAPQRRPVSTYAGTAAQDKELQAIFERTYGAVKRESFLPPKAPKRPVADNSEEKRRELKQAFSGEDYLLVDGYNIIFAWDELKKAAAENLDAARKKLCDLLCNYQGYRRCRVILVFDAYKVKGGLGSVEKYHNITIVYTKEAETADAYIERATYEIGRQHRVRVATSDGPEQIIILGHGALRLSASAFHEEMMEVQKQIGDTVWQNNRKNAKTGAVRAALERAKEDGSC